MKKYIFGKRDSIHIIDLTQTLELTKIALEKVYETISNSNNSQVVFEDKDLDFKVASMPFADKFQLHIYAALAEQERDFISSRTKAALRSWKERNPHKKLGAPTYHLTKLNQGKKDKAFKEAQKVSGIILPLKREGLSLRSICHQLNKNGIRTSRGKDFHPSLVSRMISVLEAA